MHFPVEQAFDRFDRARRRPDEAPPHDAYPESACAEPNHDPGTVDQRQANTSPPSTDIAAAAKKIAIVAVPPLTPAEWAERDLQSPDFVLGSWLSTTSRLLLVGDTGIGKTNFLIALGMRLSLGEGFLHWAPRRPCRVLYIEGEMSRRLLKRRLNDEEARIGRRAENFFALSMEDIEQRKPFNTLEGAAWLIAFIRKIGGVEIVIFDNIMCLTVGDMKDPEAWQRTLPLVLHLTKAEIGQIWAHHTGKNSTDSYGDKSREWQMDTHIHLEEVKRGDTDISFSLTFKKARERTPDTRADFHDVKVALVNDRWEHHQAEAVRPGKVSPRDQKALDALVNVLAGDKITMLPGSRRAAHRDDWAAECNARGLIDLTGKPDSARTLMNTFRRGLVAANLIACEGDFQWLRR